MNYGIDSVSGLFPRYNPINAPFGSVLIDCVESGAMSDWYFTPDGRYFYVTPSGRTGFLHMPATSLLGRIVKNLGFPGCEMYESGLEFYSDKILWPMSNDGGMLWYDRPVMLPIKCGEEYRNTHLAKFRFNNGIMSGWFFERIKEEKKIFSTCLFKVGDWVIYGKQLNRPDGYGKAARVCGVKFEDGYWQWWKDPVSKHLRRCEDYVVVAHDVEIKKASPGVEKWNEAFCRPRYDQTKQNYYRDSVGWIFTDCSDRY